MSKIMFLYNNLEREHINIKFVKEELELLGNKVYLMHLASGDILRKLLKVRPDVIVTFPVTTQNQIYIYTFAKIICRSVIVTFTTEGLIDFENQESLTLSAGIYDYSDKLVDYHAFWGELVAERLGAVLQKQRKLSDTKRIRIFGNPMYEKDRILEYCGKNEIIRELSLNTKNKVLILSGFHTSYYEKEEIINAQDIINTDNYDEEHINMILDSFRNQRLYLDKYIDNILFAAEKNQDVLFLVKLHPQEILMQKGNRKLPYLEKLENISNVVIIKESIPIGVLLSQVDFMVHYGSTVDLEAYIYNVPTLKLEGKAENKLFFVEGIRLTDSTYYEDVQDKTGIDKYVQMLKRKVSLFKNNGEVENQLYEYMNYKMNQEYHPSKKFAVFLNSINKNDRLRLERKEYVNFYQWIGKQIILKIKKTKGI